MSVTKVVANSNFSGTGHQNQNGISKDKKVTAFLPKTGIFNKKISNLTYL